jgi:hypothetical protein
MGKLIMALMFVSTTVLAQPVGLNPVLVPEGDFAIRLGFMLGVVNTDNAAEAEDKLTDHGILPTNGWISDMPVTPTTLSELRMAVESAVSLGQITSLSSARVDSVFARVVEEFGLNVTVNAAPADNYTQPPVANQAAVDDYYATNGAPVYTYYAPPATYIGMYAWMACPFWWGGYWFGGYWMLRDFHHPYMFRGRQVFISNHYTGHDGRMIVLDPAQRGHWTLPPRTVVRQRMEIPGAEVHVIHGGGGHFNGGHFGGGGHHR